MFSELSKESDLLQQSVLTEKQSQELFIDGNRLYNVDGGYFRRLNVMVAVIDSPCRLYFLNTLCMRLCFLYFVCYSSSRMVINCKIRIIQCM